MSVAKIVWMSIGLTFLGGVVGGLLGWALPEVAPGFSRWWFGEPITWLKAIIYCTAYGVSAGFSLAVIIVVFKVLGRPKNSAPQSEVQEDA